MTIVKEEETPCSFSNEESKGEKQENCEFSKAHSNKDANPTATATAPSSTFLKGEQRTPPQLTKSSLQEALSKPYAKPISKQNKVDGRRGRTAYKLHIYQERTRLKVLDLESRMDAIGNKKNAEW